MEGEAEAANPAYVAFISYSHKDAALGRWLHRRLETYRLPRRLVGTPGEHGPVPARLTPIFRDRDELPAAGDLSEKVRAALAASRSLIVLCSPDSAASPWVAREIATFREVHPGAPIYTAVVAGEPAHCFPAPLTEGGREPLAADLRGEGDGRRLGLLKLVAGLAGVGLDDLVQRDAQRRVRRVTYVTAAAVAAMLVMAAMTALALNARAEAQRQRAEAEGLVEFMLTDLRDRLRSVGRLDVLSAVNRRALQYYDGRDDLSSLPDDSLGRRARIFQAMGEDALRRRDTMGALAAYKSALQTTGAQLARRPDDQQRLLHHAGSLNGMGRVHEERCEWGAALHYFSSFAGASERLRELAPGNLDYLMRAASAAVDLGNVYLRRTGDYASAERSYENAIRLLDAAAGAGKVDPHVLLMKANAYGWMADTFYYRAMWGQSLAARRRQHAIVETLHLQAPLDADIRFRLAAADRGLAYSLLKSGDRVAALERLRSAGASVAGLTRQDPANREWAAFQEKVISDLAAMRGAAGPGTMQKGPAVRAAPLPTNGLCAQSPQHGDRK